MLKTPLTLLLVSLFGLAWAQESLPSLNGKWFAEFISGDGHPRSAVLVIAEGASTWKDFARGGQRKNNPCIGPEFPVTVRLRSPGEIGIHVNEEKLSGCGDIRASLKLVDDKTLEGIFPDGRPLKFTRR